MDIPSPEIAQDKRNRAVGSLLGIAVALAASTLAWGCKASELPGMVDDPGRLRQVCDSTTIDFAMAQRIHSRTKSKIQVLSPDFIDSTRPKYDGVVVKYPGIVFDVDPAASHELLEGSRDSLGKAGYSLLLYDRSFGIPGSLDRMALVKDTSILEVIRTIGTNGANYDIQNDSVVAFVASLRRRYSLKPMGVGFDWCEFRIEDPSADWKTIAKQVSVFSPDVVDQGTGTVEELEKEFRASKTIYLWWD